MMPAQMPSHSHCHVANKHLMMWFIEQKVAMSAMLTKKSNVRKAEKIQQIIDGLQKNFECPIW